MSSFQTYLDENFTEVELKQVQHRYSDERQKRLRDDSIDQFIDVSLSDKFRHFQEDPWVDESAVKDVQDMFPNSRCEVLIAGAGLGGLMNAVRMVQAGVRPEDLRIIDPAGGFGGAWYYNRYPGLMCDIESYCYLPLLEETGYIPKNRYARGEEICKYANMIANKWHITNSAIFHTKAEKLVWDEANKEWQVQLVQSRKKMQPQSIDIRSQIVVMAFHSSRWDYSVTGGSPEDLSLEKLKDKRVAVIGTGASAIQIVPQVAKWCKHLYVVQRTPSAVDERGQRETDPKWFKENVATSPGWQRERLRNFHEQWNIEGRPATNLVDDAWTTSIGLIAVLGNLVGPKTIEEVPAYVQSLFAADLPHQNRIRARVESTVKDPDTARKLQPWYPSWCKRPCFRDEYLPTFNRDNVTLVDTNGKGLDSFTSDSIVAGKDSYPVDLVIFATGFRSPFAGTPAEKGNLNITGLDGVSMSEEWAKYGPSTLHGILRLEFPNLFLSGPFQASTSPDYLFNVDELAKHSAFILAEAKKRANGQPFAVVPTANAVKEWASQVAMRSLSMIPMMGCTPSYFNVEGLFDRLPPEEQAKLASSGMWGHGIENFLQLIETWRSEGNMQGIEVRV